MKKIYTSLSVLLFAGISAMAQPLANFESFSLPTGSFLDGSGDAVDATFSSGHAAFGNTYQTGFGGYWSNGWAYSNEMNDTTGGFGNIYGSYAPGGHASANYAVGQQYSTIAITGADAGKPVKGMYVTNGTFAALSMKNGDSFAKKFGGATGNDPDYFKLSIQAYSGGTLKTATVDFYLADYRAANNTLDYIVKSWTFVDLSTLGNADSLLFTMHSSDSGQFGINTPLFFCVDDVITDSDTADFENLNLSAGSHWTKDSRTLSNVFTDGNMHFNNTYTLSSYGDYWSSGFAISNMTDTVTAGYTNPYSAFAGSGSSSASYAVSQNHTIVSMSQYAVAQHIDVTNTTYAALSMKNGDTFAKKFGGATGNDPDFFLLTIKAYRSGALKNDSVNFYLADYRFTDNSKDYIVKGWQMVDISKLGEADSLLFTLTSSDVGQFGMNTPAYFALDNISMGTVNGIATAHPSIDFGMYPNPASQVINVDAGRDQVQGISISDLSGKTLIEASGSRVDVSSLANGLYLLRVQTANGSGVKRFLKQ